MKLNKIASSICIRMQNMFILYSNKLFNGDYRKSAQIFNITFMTASIYREWFFCPS